MFFFKDLNQSQNEEGGDTADPAMLDIASNFIVERNTAHLSGFIKPPEQPRKRFKISLKNGKSDNGEISEAI